MLRVSDDHRRARIARRHGLDPDHRYGAIGAATTAMTALHATEPATPHLALHARVRELTVEDVEAALYEERSLVKPMAMRRTLFVVTRDLLPAVAGCAGRRVAEVERRRLAKEAGAVARGSWATEWIAAASSRSWTCLTGRELSARELRDALPAPRGDVHGGAGDEVVGGGVDDVAAPDDPHRRRRRRAGAQRRALADLPAAVDVDGELARRGDDADRVRRPAYAEVVRHWLWTFGPATEADLVWWLGSTKTAVRKALSDVDAVPVELEDGSTGWVLPDDTADLEAPPQAEPWVALLPTLDPTTMGWRERAFYLDPAHTPYLFDSAGNAGTTVWVNGRIVGCWVQDERGAGPAHPHGGGLPGRAAAARRRGGPPRRVPRRRAHHERVRLAADEAISESADANLDRRRRSRAHAGRPCDRQGAGRRWGPGAQPPAETQNMRRDSAAWAGRPCDRQGAGRRMGSGGAAPGGDSGSSRTAGRQGRVRPSRWMTVVTKEKEARRSVWALRRSKNASMTGAASAT